MILISKIACLPSVLMLGVAVWMFVQPSLEVWVVLTCILLGVFSLGIYPVMLELSVECTYPLDESVVTGLCYLSSALQGSLLMFTENLFHTELASQQERDIQTCSSHSQDGGDTAGMEAKDFTSYLIYINIY